MTNRTKWTLALGGTAVVLTYLLWPLPQPDQKIEFDTKAIEAKYAFLDTLRPTSSQRPNLLLIVADDLSRQDLSLYGNKLINTPNLDSIGLLGAVCTEGYVTSPICSPSRAGLLTGRYQQRFGFDRIVHTRYARNRLEWLVFKYFITTKNWLLLGKPVAPPFTEVVKQGLPPEQLTLAELLKASGYKTAIYGKWHLGHGDHALPFKRGFDEHYGFYEGYSLYMADTNNPNVVNHRVPRWSDFSDPFIWGAGRSGNCAVRLNGKVIDDQYYLTDRLAEKGVDFIRANRNQPFFLYLPFLTPHTPFQATKPFYDRLGHIPDHGRRVYMAMIAQLDHAVGQVINTLRAEGLLENTLIVLISDNGGATYTLAADNSPFKGGKLSHFEGGIRVPFLFRWDGKVKPGTVINTPVTSLDIFATMSSLLGMQLPDQHALDGQSLLDSVRPPRNLFWRCDYSWAVRSGPWKLVAEEGVEDEIPHKVRLYNMTTDPYEKNNLANLNPPLVDSLTNLHRQWEKGTMPPKWPNVMHFRFGHADGEVSWFPL